MPLSDLSKINLDQLPNKKIPLVEGLEEELLTNLELDPLSVEISESEKKKLMRKIIDNLFDLFEKVRGEQKKILYNTCFNEGKDGISVNGNIMLRGILKTFDNINSKSEILDREIMSIVEILSSDLKEIFLKELSDTYGKEYGYRYINNNKEYN